MNVRALGFFLFVEPCDKVFVASQDGVADRADSAAVSFNTVYTARNMHKPFRSVKRGKCRGFNPFAVFQLCAADRTGSGSAGKTFLFGLAPVFAVKNRKRHAAGDGKKEGIAEPQKEYPRERKQQYLNNDPHYYKYRRIIEVVRDCFRILVFGTVSRIFHYY
jgi:hypothetical protein